MQHYLAFIWNMRNRELANLVSELVGRLDAEPPKWTCALATDGLRVYVHARPPSSPVYLLKRESGCIFGTVFRRGSVQQASCELTFDHHETAKIQKSYGQHLIDSYWGSYVALLRDDSGREVRVLRDPTGALPCFLTSIGDITVVYSDIEDCASIGLPDCTINWEHVTAYLWYSRLVTRGTGLNSVRQVYAGECITVSPDGISEVFYWSPQRILSARIIDDRQEAMAELKEVVQYCVAAWAACYRSILHELSGGLDSAIVLACLARSTDPASLICETFFTHSATGDERHFAQKAAKSAGVDLIQTPLQPSARSLQYMLDSNRYATPTWMRLIPESDSVREQLVKKRRIEAVFSGQGGDHFFQQMKTPLIAAEYVWRNGVRPELLSVLADTSHFTKDPVWSVTVAALTSGILRRKHDPYRQLKSPVLLSPGARDTLNFAEIRHPWLDCSNRIPGSKLLQILNVIDSQNFYQVPCRFADIVHPLISQPIIELALQIPCYVLTYNGIDRALVRDAFRKMLPPEIAERTIKGATTSYASSLLVGNLKFLREYLLDGILVHEGLLDRQTIEASVTEAKVIRESRHLLLPLFNAVKAEAWLRTWIGESRRPTT